MPNFQNKNYCKKIRNKFKKWLPLSIQIFYYLKNILDPEFPNKIYSLGIISFEIIFVKIFLYIKCAFFGILLIPTIKYCGMSPLIALCVENKLNKKKLAKKLNKIFPSDWNWKFTVEIPFYAHLKAINISKQLNDKERKSAALENLGIRRIIKKSYEKA
jgi:metal-sulfur cluster biosynthetic enzyme